MLVSCLCFWKGKDFNNTDDKACRCQSSHIVQKCRLNGTGIDASKPNKNWSTLQKPKAKKVKSNEGVIDIEAVQEKRKKAKATPAARH